MTTSKIKIVFFGTSVFGIPILDELLRAGYAITAIVTTPDAPSGRSQDPKKPAVKAWAAQTGVPVLQPKNLRDKAFVVALQSLNADVFLIAAYGKIIPKEILELSPHGTVNIHPSLLPKYRGASPIQTAILSGDAETGVSVILADAKMDHGPIIAQEKTFIADDDTSETLHDRLASLAAEMVTRYLEEWLKGRIASREQDHDKATFTKILRREDGKIDWGKSAAELARMVRAYYPWPGAFTFLPSVASLHPSEVSDEGGVKGGLPDGKRLKLLKVRIWKTEIEDEIIRKPLDYARGPAHGAGEPGQIFQTPDGELAVKCGKNALLLRKVQKEGGEPMSGKGFLNGHTQLVGRRLH